MNETLGGFNPVFVFVAYAAVWLLFFGYVFYIARRQADIRAEIADLRQEIERRKAGEAKGQAEASPLTKP